MDKHKDIFFLCIVGTSLLLSALLCGSCFAAGVTIGNGATITLAGSPTITTIDLDISGTLSGGAGNIDFSGNWSRGGTFTAGSSTVSIVGAGASLVNNSNTFFNFSCVTASKSITFQSAVTQTVTNSLNLNGQAAGTRIVLRSSASGTQWNVDPQATLSVQYVDVKDSNNLSAVNPTITPSFSMDSGNNQDWNFGSLSISGNQSMVVGSQSGPLTIDITFTNSNTANRNIIIDLASDSSGANEFRDTSGGAAVTSVVVAAGSTSTIFYYVDNASGSPTITASTLGYTSGTITMTVSTITFQVSAASPQIAGSNFILTITAKDQTGATVTGYAGTVNITVNYVSPATGAGVLGITSTSAFVGGIATITNQTFSDCGTLTIKATDQATPSMTGTSANIVFLPFDFTVELTGLDTDAAGSAVDKHVVSKPFTLSVTSRNAAGTACPNYKGNTLLSIDYVSPSADQSGSLAISTLGVTNWTNGIAAVTAQTYNRWGTISIKAADATDTTRTGVSPDIFFVPKDFTLTLSAIPASRNFYYTNESFTVTVTVRDFNNLAIVNYQGTISFSGEGLNLPANYTFTLSDAGVHVFNGVNGSRQAETSVFAADTGTSSVAGTSAAIDIITGTIKVISASGPVGPVLVEVNIVDSAGSVLISDDSTTFTVSLSEFIADNSASSEAAETPVQVSGGIATITVTDDSAEVVTVTPSSVPELSVETGTVTFGTVSGAGVGIQIWREVKEGQE